MSKKNNITAVNTSAGQGKRSRPITLNDVMSMNPKGLLRVAGTTIADSQIAQFVNNGIDDLYMVTLGRDNAKPLQERFGDGRNLGLTIHYSHPSFEPLNTGSGDGILRNIDEHELSGTSIILPNDNLFEYDVDKVMKIHQDNDAVVTMMTIPMKPVATLRTYGLLDVTKNVVTRIVEKPQSEADIMKSMGYENLSSLDSDIVYVNTAGYVVNNDKLRELAKQAWVSRGRKKSFDMAGNLIAGLIESGETVCSAPIDKWGDLGTVPNLLRTNRRVLGGEFKTLNSMVENASLDGSKKYMLLDNNVIIHVGAYTKKDSTGKTLQQKIEDNSVTIGPDVFIGRNCIIEEGVEISYSTLEKYATVGKNAKVEGCYILDSSLIGPYATLRNCALAERVRVFSNHKNQTLVNGGSAIGPQVDIPAGTELKNVTIMPGYEFAQKEIINRQVLKPTDEQVLALYHAFTD